MVRLIVEDAGERRAFSVGEGRLTMGSAPEAKLQLSAMGVAGVHAEIEVHGGKATMHPKPGVTPPHVLGRAMHGPVVMQHGVPVKIGAAVITAEYEGHAGPVAAAAPKIVRGGAHAGARSKRDADDEPGRSRRQHSHGVPSWVWIAVGLPILALVGWFVFGKLLGGDARSIGEASAPAYLANARTRFEHAQFDLALAQLNRIPADAKLDPQLAAQVAEMRQKIESTIAESALDSNNAMAGKRYLDSQLKNFVDRWMTGKITSPEARVFLKRAKYFHEKWPTHPEMDWVERQEGRFKGAIDLSKPPTFADIEFEVQALTWSFPRNYEEAFAVTRAFQQTAQGEDVAKSAAFLTELEGKREAWFKDRLEEARYQFDLKEKGKSLGVLLSIIRYAGDAKMADNAAERLLLYEDIDSWLRGYKTYDQDGYEAISQNRVIAAFLRK
jgi:hypothetical protein